MTRILVAVGLCVTVATAHAERIGIREACGRRVMEQLARVARPGLVHRVRLPGKCTNLTLPGWLGARPRVRPGTPPREIEVYLGAKLLGVIVLRGPEGWLRKRGARGYALGPAEAEVIETQPRRRWITRRYTVPTPGQHARHRTAVEEVEEWSRDEGGAGR